MIEGKRKRGRQPGAHGRWSPFLKRQVVGRVLAIAGAAGDVERAFAMVALNGHPHLRLEFPKSKQSRDAAGWRQLSEPRSDAKVRAYIDAATGSAHAGALKWVSGKRKVKRKELIPLTDTMVRDAYYPYLRNLARGSREVELLVDEIAAFLSPKLPDNARILAEKIIASRLQERDKHLASGSGN